jgi:glutamine synthetase
MPAGPGPGLGVWGRPVYLPSLWRGDRRWGKSQYFRKWGAVDLEELTRQAESGEIDTVLLALTDMQGRLQGKRLAVDHFIDDVAAHGAEGCNYLLAVDVEMNTVDGFAMASWDRGYGDFVMKPDLATLRPVPWHPATALLLADLEWADGSPVMASPRQVLRGQIERLAERGWSANAATELEFLVFRDSYEQAWKKGYSGLDPANLYNVDYSLMGTAKIEPLIRRIRNAMAGAGLRVENSKGECNLGQHEINFRYSDALGCADEHAIYKTAAKEIADQEGMAISFMAKFDEREGSSCHIHFSLADAEGALFHRERGVFESFLAGQLRYARELTLLVAPNINSYKRFAAGSFAPTTIAWANDNRTCAFRVVGDGAALRFENRSGGADLNPYMALAATVAAGLAGVEARLELEPAYVGNAYLATDRPRLPGTLREARDLFADSQLAQTAFGPEVVAHYVNAADVELAAFETAVTDWERTRGFERL